MMAHTAMSAAALKAAAGVKATGRKLAKPVMAYSLSWAPGEAVTPADMLDAAKATLAALGLEEHQALIVCHNDTSHPHVHILVNRVNPDTGVAHTGSLAKERLSDWAFDYRDARGELHFCPARTKAHAARQARRSKVVTRDPQPRQQPRQRPRSRPQWAAARSDRDYADAIAAAHAELFASQADAERAGQVRRQQEAATFWTARRATRDAIRARYQAALDAAHDPALAARHDRLADLLIAATPDLALATMTRDRSTFTRQELARHIGRHTRTADAFRAVLDRLERSAELVTLARDDRGRQRLTTRGQLTIERDMEHHARSLHDARHRPVATVRPKGITLSRDQDAALQHVLAPPRLAAVTGFAGTGKSTMLAGARRSFEAAGYRLQGMALSAVAADSLKNGSGIDSRTIHSRLGQWDKGINLPTDKDVIVVDEAGMIASRHMERILRHAEQGRAKVILVGDPEQLQAIEAGAAYRAIVDRIGAAELNTVRRQAVDWQKDATKELATGRTQTALDRYEAAGMVHGHEPGEDAHAALVEGWRQARAERPDQSQMILAFTRADVRTLNERARAVMREEGRLGADTPLKTEAGRRSFATGDRIYFLKNDAGLGVRNGTLATIERIKGQTVVARLDGEGGRRVMFGMGAYGHIDQGYAATVHKSQGVTVDRAHVLATPNFNRHLAYVAMTRHRDRLDVHWSQEAFGNRARLVRVLSREAAKDTTLDFDEASELTAPRQRQGGAGRAAPSFRAAANTNSSMRPAQRPSPEAMLDAVRATAAERHRHETAQRRQAASDLADDADDMAGLKPEADMRATILSTAEIAAFDDETAQLARVMQEGHEAEQAAEQDGRYDLGLEAARNWQEAMLDPAVRVARHEHRTGGIEREAGAPATRKLDLSRRYEP